MQYKLAPLYVRPWTVLGMTPQQIENHYEGNYGAALRQLNERGRKLKQLYGATNWRAPAPTMQTPPAINAP